MTKSAFEWAVSVNVGTKSGSDMTKFAFELAVSVRLGTKFGLGVI